MKKNPNYSSRNYVPRPNADKAPSPSEAESFFILFSGFVRLFHVKHFFENVFCLIHIKNPKPVEDSRAFGFFRTSVSLFHVKHFFGTVFCPASRKKSRDMLRLFFYRPYLFASAAIFSASFPSSFPHLMRQLQLSSGVPGRFIRWRPFSPRRSCAGTMTSLASEA